jgi:hypothetical protein
MPSHTSPTTPQSSLEELATGLAGRGYQASLLTPAGASPHLEVRHPRVSALADTIYAADGWFWWSWAERITPADDVPAATSKIAAVLHVTEEPAQS